MGKGKLLPAVPFPSRLPREQHGIAVPGPGNGLYPWVAGHRRKETCCPAALPWLELLLLRIGVGRWNRAASVPAARRTGSEGPRIV